MTIHGGSSVCPFKGLASFDVADAAYFFGRERLVAELVARLVGAPLLAVVGPSGGGKSSVLRAGLLPALSAGVLPGSEAWRQTAMRPGRHPVRELDRARARLGGDRRALLAIDQFEETFTVCEDAAERAAFLDAIVRAAHEPEGRMIVALALRSDFYGRCAVHGDFADLLEANQVLVGPMGRDELRRAIERPAQRVGPARGARTHRRAAGRRRGGARRASVAVDRAAGAVGAPPRPAPDTRGLRAQRRRSRRRRAAGRGRLRATRARAAAAGTARPAATGGDRRGRCGHAPARRAERARPRGRRRGRGTAHHPPAAHGQRGHARGRARGARARMAATPRLAAPGRRGAAAAAPPPRRGARVARRRARSRRALPRRPAGVRAGVVANARRRAQRHRARVPDARAAPRASARSGGCASGSSASARCWSSPSSPVSSP